MTFQLIRGSLEARAKQDLDNAGIIESRIFFDNVGETPGKSDETYAVVSLSFTDTVQDTVACEGIEDLRGSIQVNVYTPRNEGSLQGEDLCLAVMKGWQEINKWRAQPTDPILQMCIRNIEGPTTLAPDTRPHAVHVVSATRICRSA